MDDTTGRQDTKGWVDTTGRKATTGQVSTIGCETNGDSPFLYRQQSLPKVHYHTHTPFHVVCHFLFRFI